MLDDIQKLAGCGDAEVEQQAQVVLELTDAKARGDITQEEYNELLEDIAGAMSIADQASDIKFKAALATAIYGVLQVV